jgi:catechol 2,3-dioxygenase-like lactoylglutathione lyase family enzyme
MQGDSLEASLTVKNLENSVVWYTDVLGFTVDRRHERGGKVIAVSLQARAVRQSGSLDTEPVTMPMCA